MKFPGPLENQRLSFLLEKAISREAQMWKVNVPKMPTNQVRIFLITPDRWLLSAVSVLSQSTGILVSWHSMGELYIIKGCALFFIGETSPCFILKPDKNDFFVFICLFCYLSYRFRKIRSLCSPVLTVVSFLYF